METDNRDAPVLDRRRFLALLGLAPLAAPSLAGCGRDADVDDGRWPGHQAGRIYLGLSVGGDLRGSLDETGPFGARRSFFPWHGDDDEQATILEDHEADRLPWVSFKPPSTRAGGWAAVAEGEHDDALRARARRYDVLERPVVATFHHEPHNDRTGTPQEFAAAWMRVHDVMQDETGLRGVASVPILGEWVFNPRNPGSPPEDYLSDDVLDRASFIGIDVYQSPTGAAYDERLGRVLAWLDGRGARDLMIGVGETGATDDYGNPTADAWWRDSWHWAEANADRLGVVSYFNSRRNNDAGVRWVLSQSPDLLEGFRASLRSEVTTQLR